ncbi:MAG: VOC family protein [Oligoflexia bacterium]|nr:VOC family protein [Oligoflexia bacterium]
MRYLHTMLRVVDLEKSLHFYRDALGFELVSRKDFPDERFTLAFLRSGDPGEARKGALLELTHNWDTRSTTRGDAYGHMAYEVDSIDEIRARLKAKGYDLSWGPGLTPSGRRKMAFIDDPDGYEIELLEGRD